MSLKIDVTERNKFLTIALGKCYHDEIVKTMPFHDGQTIHTCKCGTTTRTGMGFGPETEVPKFKQEFDFSTGDGMQKLRDWLELKDNEHLLGDFVVWTEHEIRYSPGVQALYWWWILLNPNTFADYLYLFLKGDRNYVARRTHV
jgi:hypothetical protein